MELMSINAVAARLGLSVHQLRRWELMFGLEIKRGRGQQRQYRPEDLSVLERIKELVEQGWPTAQIRPQLEAEGLVTPKLIGLPPPPGNPEVLMEAVIGLRNFAERRFIEISRQIDELRQLMITVTLKQELEGETASPWQPVTREPLVEPTHHRLPPQEIAIGPAAEMHIEHAESVPQEKPASPPPIGEITDQNYLTILGKALDMVGWTDEQADGYSQKTFGVPHWDELGRSQAENLIAHLIKQMETAKHIQDQYA
jgi:DNA-binding transcriptional MerR regulator